MERIILIHWNKSTGPEPIIQYPPDKPFPGKDIFVKIWSKHEMNADNSMIEFVPDKSSESKERYISVLQKYEGEIYFLILKYSEIESDSKKDDITNNPDILAIISKNLVEMVNTNQITRSIFEAFNTIKNYSKLDIEEDLLDFFQNRIKSTILKILRNGVISKTELNEILSKEYGFSTINIDLIIISFFQENLAIKLTVSGLGECYFLIKDLTLIRVPPKNILDQFSDKSLQIDEETKLSYKNKYANFFESHKVLSEIENKLLINYIVDPEVLILIKELREHRISVNECLNLINNREELFNELLEKNLIFESMGFVYLFTDVRFIKFTPYYLINRLNSAYHSNEISFEQYKTHLKLLLAEQQDPNTTLIEYEIV